MGVPVTSIAGEWIVGFNQPALTQAISRLRHQSQDKTSSAGKGPTIKLGAQVADAAKLKNSQSEQGALLGTVQPGSLAEKAGLQTGDVIISLVGLPITNADDLSRALQLIATRQILNPPLTFLRNGQPNTVTLNL
ncbi:MAG TPA: PDZ domain-containing protein [Chloroflexia bacterium]|nr:PDZ domain-containing protein [Chloroflexia bacterium]